MYHNNFRSSVVHRSDRCIKDNCNRLLPWNHPTLYTNGLCERHFFSMDLSLNDDDNSNINGDTNNSNCLISQSISKEKHIYSTINQYKPLRGDIRKTREIFDGHQW